MRRAIAFVWTVLILGCQPQPLDPEAVVRKSELPAKGPGPCWQIEPKVLLFKPRCEGPPRTAYPVLKHFDIRRNYNPGGGEEVNLIVETEERPLHQREFLRVDWSRPSALPARPIWRLPLALIGLVLVGAAVLWSRRRR